MTEAPSYLLIAFLWVFGVIGGVFLRYAGWAAKQPPASAGVKAWWTARLGSNLSSIILGVLSTGMWAEGTLYRALNLQALRLDLTYGLTPIAGAAVAFFAHYILAAGKRRAEAAAGGPPEGD